MYNCVHRFPKIQSFLKKQSSGYEPKKSTPLDLEQVKKFIEEAPDAEWLLVKVRVAYVSRTRYNRSSYPRLILDLVYL